MAERLMRHALAAESEPLASIRVLSAGVSAMSGEHASPNAIRALDLVGLDLRDHRSRQLSEEMLDQAKAVFCMTQSHKYLIQMSFDRAPEHLYLMRECIPHVIDRDIPDPFGQNLDVYKACRDSMVEAIPAIIHFLKTLNLKQ
ncbi:MAG: hypothetical protein B7X06_02680 [Verrucomicrobia bacterium 21-51-4]|nr:MAG: hypothetical protein B7X06_02680 [Verrucomicrobia bacterium 21-51-4]